MKKPITNDEEETIRRLVHTALAGSDNTVKMPMKVTHKYTPIRKMGFPEGVQCWCGSVLEFRYHEPGMKKRRQEFFAQHDECLPPGSEQV